MTNDEIPKPESLAAFLRFPRWPERDRISGNKWAILHISLGQICLLIICSTQEMMGKTSQRIAVVSFAAAIAIALFLCGILAWLLSVSQFITHPDFFPLASPLGIRYQQFVATVLPGFLAAVLGMAVAFKMGWRRNRLLCGTLGVVLLQRLLELHIVFVIVNSGLKQ